MGGVKRWLTLNPNPTQWVMLGLLCLGACSPEGHRAGEWPAYQGGPERNQYSSLDQIDRGNVTSLEVAWSYRTGDADAEGRSQIQCNPLIVGGVLYGTSPRINVFALDAATGRQLWRFDPFTEGSGRTAVGVNRGVSYWESGDEARILFTAGPYLYALDAATGEPVESFGEGGRVDLKGGLGRDVSDLYLIATTPGAVYRDLIILGCRTSEGPGPAAPGHIRAFDVRSGELVWIFHTIPHPGELGYETWPEDAWTRVGGANCWAGMAVDRDRGIVYVPTGSPAFDFWGGDRKGANLFGNSLIALKAETGKRIWHYQFVHHDLWDRDLPAPPNLVTLTIDGRRVDAAAQITKSGHVFVFDRVTGEPLHPIEEVPVPPSDLEGEETWPTQPVPLRPPPFARQAFTEDLVTDLSPESREAVLARLREIRTGRPFIPPSTQGTMIFPGFDGGGEWGGAAFDPATGWLYVNSNEMPWILTMVPAHEKERKATLGEQVYAVNCAGCHGSDGQGDPQQVYPPLPDLQARYKGEELTQLIETGKGFMPAFEYLEDEEMAALVAFLLGDEGEEPVGPEAPPSVPYTFTGYNRFFDPDGYPAVRPPWGTLAAIDLGRGEIVWQVPLGELPELTARGIPPTGTENYGGPVVTAGGLIFVGATKDEKFRAFDKENGRLLWETDLPAGGYATPATYQTGGRQFVVIAAGGGKMGTKSGDTYIAYALPR